MGVVFFLADQTHGPSWTKLEFDRFPESFCLKARLRGGNPVAGALFCGCAFCIILLPLSTSLMDLSVFRALLSSAWYPPLCPLG